MRFAKIVFWCAAAWGFVVLTPLYFMLDWVGQQYPPAITHPELYYGFLGVALAWQAAFAIIATDPARYRLMMVPSVLEKFTYAGALLVLHLQGRVSPAQLWSGAVDFLLGVLFLAAFFKTKAASSK